MPAEFPEDPSPEEPGSSRDRLWAFLHDVIDATEDPDKTIIEVLEFLGVDPADIPSRTPVTIEQVQDEIQAIKRALVMLDRLEEQNPEADSSLSRTPNDEGDPELQETRMHLAGAIARSGYSQKELISLLSLLRSERRPKRDLLVSGMLSGKRTERHYPAQTLTDTFWRSQDPLDYFNAVLVFSNVLTDANVTVEGLLTMAEAIHGFDSGLGSNVSVPYPNWPETVLIQFEVSQMTEMTRELEELDRLRKEMNDSASDAPSDAP